jgi:hypothetical protein
MLARWKDADFEIPPASPDHINNPQHWRDRAEEARAKAELMSDHFAIATMLRVADEYDHLAEQAELRQREGEPTG